MKKFNQDLYNEYDAKGKAAAALFLMKRHPRSDIILHSGYFHDISVVHAGDGLREYEDTYDVEVKVGWKGGTYPFADLRIPERKRHLFKDGTHLITFSADYKQCFLTEAATILASPSVTIETKYGLDEFFVVPLGNTICHSLTYTNFS